jgi:GH24 family phage-related lysozyme (muramidase)
MMGSSGRSFTILPEGRPILKREEGLSTRWKCSYGQWPISLGATELNLTADNVECAHVQLVLVP